MEINALAKSENRTRSNWIVTALLRHVEERKAAKKIAVVPSAVDADAPSSSSIHSLNEEPPARETKPVLGTRHTLREIAPREKPHSKK